MAAAYENNQSCAVCLELYDDPRVLPCGHSYCFKCLMKMTNKSFNTRDVLTCPMCQAESSFACGDQASYTKNYELNSLVQSFISESMTQDSHSEEHYCELCDQPTPAKRACVECEATYCEKCFNSYHPMCGKFGKHNIVNADQPFKRQKVMTKYNKNMYCNDCDIILSLAGLGGHNKHDVVSLDKAHSIFKVKLEEATGNIDLMQSTLKSSLDNSKDKLKAVVSMFEEIERDVASTKAIVLSELGADIKAAEAAIDHLLPAISTYRELRVRADTISFIEECQKTLRRSSLKQDFQNILSLFDRIDRLTCSSSAILKEVKKFEICIIPVQKSTAQAGETEDTPSLLDNINDTSSLFDNIDDTAIVHVSDSSLPSASVMLPNVTFYNEYATFGNFNRRRHLVRTIGDELRYSYDRPELFGYDPPLEILPGDDLVATCGFSSMTRINTTTYGPDTSSEMCFPYIIYYSDAIDNNNLACWQYKTVDLCKLDTKNNFPVIDGCRWQEFTDRKSPSTKQMIDEVTGTCVFNACTDECYRVIQNAKDHPCFQGELGEYLHILMARDPTNRQFIAALATCDDVAGRGDQLMALSWVLLAALLATLLQ